MKNRILFIAILCVMFVVFVTACGNKDNTDNDGMTKSALDNLNDSGFPIVDDDITLKMFTVKSNQSIKVDWNDLLVWNEYEEMTNINLDWIEQVSGDTLEEKRNLALSGGNMPDVFFAAQFPNSDILKHGEQGVFLRLNDLIDDYAPNLKKLMEEDPNIEKGLTFPDGNIYSLPDISDNDFLSIQLGARPWIDEEWLDQLGMGPPETTDEFYEFLIAVKESDDSMVPYSGVNMDNFIDWIKGAFGLNNVGGGQVDLDPDGDDLRFIATSEEYREMLEYIHTLYDEKLIEQNIFSIEWDQFMANAGDGKYAATMFYDPKTTFGGKGEDFISLSALEGPNGDKMYTGVQPPLSNIAQFIITDQNPNPAATMRWIDYFYSEEGAKLMYMGVEGESYVEKDGELKYVDDIENANNREQAIAEHVPWLGVGPPGLVTADVFDGSETSDESLESADKIRPYIPEEIWGGFTYTNEENKFMNATGSDIEKYVEEMRDKFISGDEKLSDDNWNKYLDSIEDMGLEEYMDIQEEAYERYQSQ